MIDVEDSNRPNESILESCAVAPADRMCCCRRPARRVCSNKGRLHVNKSPRYASLHAARVPGRIRGVVEGARIFGVEIEDPI
jgi:hypothetical protein